MSKGLSILQELRNKSGLELYLNGLVSPHKSIFKVKSESDTLLYYEVDLEGASCSCPDFSKRGNILRCKHQMAVEYYIKNTPLILAQ